MTPERWKQIDQLFHATLAQPPSLRAAFLAQACAGDEVLRREVESLLSYHDISASFIEKPAGDVAAQLLASNKSKYTSGHEIANYRIVNELGSGGMGEVYLAQDLKLGRKIALKLLPIEFTSQPELVRRFEMEARAASALNHPNIVTIHEIGQSGSCHFIATEFVDGQTLRQRMASFAKDPMSIVQILDIGSQIASALAAAHSAGIVHRDIKPDNIMLRRDGFVKVLDFGLAKLSPQITATEASTVNTNPGIVMGTVRYMSPEQARGLEVDARTDIWSLGIVLYELITGRMPFTGETPSHVIVAILETKPPALSRYSEVPLELERIVAKTLRRHRDRRYQRAKDLVLDLNNLRKELETNTRLYGPSRPLRRNVPNARVSSEPHLSAANTVRLETPVATLKEAHVTTRRAHYKKAALVAASVLLVALGALALYEIVRRYRSAALFSTPFQSIELLRLTNSGRVSDSAISPDGQYVSYVVESGGKQSIWLRQINTSQNVQVVAADDLQFYGATFSKKGDYLYYIAKERNNSIGTLYRIPSLGGEPVKLIRDVDGPITLSPDEKQLAFVRGSSTGERALMLATIAGTDERKLASRMGYESFSFGGPAWSPDGKAIVCGAAYTLETERFVTLVAVDVENGSIRVLTPHKWKAIGRITWLQDGKGIVFTAAELSSGSTSQLWYMDHSTGEVSRISKDLQDYHGASITSDARTLITKQSKTVSSLWIAPNNDAERASAIISYNDDGLDTAYYFRTRFSWMPDGRIIYTAMANGIPSLWVMSATGTDNRQLTTNKTVSTFPSITPDARKIVFVAENSGFANVWTMDLDGGNVKQLTTGPDESWAWCSPEGKWVVYHSSNQGKRTLWRVPLEGGNPEQLTDYPSVVPVVSPNGQWIVAYYRLAPKDPWRFGIIPFNGGRPVKSFEVPQGVLFQSLVRWTNDGAALAYIVNKDGVSNIWIQPVDGRPAKQLTNFRSDQIFWFEWSPDGKQLGVSRGAVTSDVVMIRR
jgi:eukaryotic-like serine/threonine-protein kinase